MSSYQPLSVSVNQQGHRIYTGSGLLAILLGLMVGFGNVWSLPKHVAESGGLVYLLVFITSMFIFGLPFVVAELALGRAAHSVGKADPIHGITELAKQSGRSQHWGLIGKIGLMVCAFVAALYSMVSGWSLAFLSRAISGDLTQRIQDVTQEPAQATWLFVSQHSEVSLFWYLLTMLLVVVVLSRVLDLGLERYSKRLILALLSCVLGLVYLAFTQGNWQEAFKIMTELDTSHFDSRALYEILVHCFYTLTMGVMAVFMLGTYAHPKQSFTSIATLAITLDSLLAVVLCFIVLSFALITPDVTVSSNFELVFLQMPSILAEQHLGQFSLVLFYTVMFIIGLTTCVVVMEPLVAWMSAQFNYSRLKASRLLAVYISFISIGIAFSFSIWKNQKISLSPKIGDKIYTWFEEASFYSILTYVTLELLLPIAALCMIYFSGFVIKSDILRPQFTRVSPRIFKLWLFIVRNVTPILVLAVLIHTSGLLDGIKIWFGWNAP